MHLTNYSINKFSENFTVDEKEFKTGSKRTITSVMERIKEMGYDIDQLWKDIAVCVPTDVGMIYLPRNDCRDHVTKIQLTFHMVLLRHFDVSYYFSNYRT